MKTTARTASVTVILTALFAVLFGADGTELNLDFQEWGGNVLIFGPALAAVLLLVKKLVPSLKGYAMLAVALVAAEGGAAALFYTGLLTDPFFLPLGEPYNWLAFGGTAFMVAAFGADMAAKLLKRTAPQGGKTVVNDKLE
ncbi:hypothetical protein [Deinococcus kurensis]|uniref:hypothetical protein n=1 Tax=Deinococcus kurensis TaxID=2662757 RepID=UPI0012D2E508|nr:hypothetical protein [Deinococcus kurensis]